MPDKLQNIKVICQGGIVHNLDALTQGLKSTGTALSLINYEPSISGGYQKILGFTKYSNTKVPGQDNAAIVGCKVVHSGVYVARLNVAGNSTDIFYGTGGSWGSKLNAANLSSSTAKVRFCSFSITGESTIACTGFDYARKFDTSQVETVINGTGAPTAPLYAEMVLSRLALAPGSINSSIVLSAPNAETDFNGLNGAIEINVGDIVTGLKRFREELYIFCRNSIFKLQGSSSANFTVIPVVRSIGCLSHDSIQELGGDLVFLSPDGFRSVAATSKIGDTDLGLLSPQVQDLILSLVGGKSLTAFSSCLIRDKSQYRLFVYNAGLTHDTDSVGMIGKVTRQIFSYQGQEGNSYDWSQHQGFYAYCADSEYQDNNQELAIIGHPTSGYLNKMESGNSLDGSSINYLYQTPGIMFQDATYRKIFLKLAVYTDITGSLSLTVNTQVDFNNPVVLQPQPIMLSTSSSGSTFGTAIFGTDTFSVPLIGVFKKNLVGSGYELALLFTGSDTNPTHRIDGFEVQYLIRDDKSAV